VQASGLPVETSPKKPDAESRQPQKKGDAADQKLGDLRPLHRGADNAQVREHHADGLGPGAEKEQRVNEVGHKQQQQIMGDANGIKHIDAFENIHREDECAAADDDDDQIDESGQGTR